MDSAGRLLLGGALGAALGYLLAQKNQEHAEEQAVPGEQAASASHDVRIPPAPPSDWRPAPISTMPTDTPASATFPANGLLSRPLIDRGAPPVREEPVSVGGSEAEILLTRDFLEEPLPGSGWRPSGSSAVDEETLEDTLPGDSGVAVSSEGAQLGLRQTEDTATPRVPGTSAEPGGQQPPRELPVVEDVVEMHAVGEVVEPAAAEGHVMEAPTLDQRMKGAPSQAGPAAEEATFAETEATLGGSRVDDLKSRIEETRRRIRHELEQPFDTLTSPRPPASDWSASAAVATGEVAVAPSVGTESGLVEQVPMDQVPIEQVPVELVPVEQVPVELVPVEQVPVEQVPEEEVPTEPMSAAVQQPPLGQVAVEPPSVEQSAAEPGAAEPPMTLSPVVPSVAEEPTFTPVVKEPTTAEPADVDLSSLESTGKEPATMQQVPVEEAPVEQASVGELLMEQAPAEQASVGERSVPEEPIEEVVVGQTTTDQEPVEPVHATTVTAAPETVQSEPTEGVTSAVDLTEELEAEPEIGLGLEEPVDYDSMKDRIERTRSRLKAKAFDAMMTGESALLGRDLEGDGSDPRPVTSVDSEVDETIETSLREEEE